VFTIDSASPSLLFTLQMSLCKESFGLKGEIAREKSYLRPLALSVERKKGPWRACISTTLKCSTVLVSNQGWVAGHALTSTLLRCASSSDLKASASCTMRAISSALSRPARKKGCGETAAEPHAAEQLGQFWGLRGAAGCCCSVVRCDEARRWGDLLNNLLNLVNDRLGAGLPRGGRGCKSPWHPPPGDLWIKAAARWLLRAARWARQACDSARYPARQPRR
jgi:hypothetical protein